MFGKCRVCAEKDKQIGDKDSRIADLKAQIEDLRSLVLPKNTPGVIPLVSLEADAIMSGKDEAIEIPDAQRAELDEIQSEATRILSGTY